MTTNAAPCRRPAVETSLEGTSVSLPPQRSLVMVQIKQILLPTDCSECSAPATHYAFDFAKQFDAELHLLHVVEDVRAVIPDYYYGAVEWPKDYLEQIETGARRRLEKLICAHGADKQRSSPAIRHGRAFAEIVRYAEEQSIDLIVIGTHGRSGLAHVLMGSVAERVVRHAPCPVLTVRPDSSSCRETE